MALKVAEFFSSIQGESTYMGLPCTFIRLAGCNLHCNYCDTLYAHKKGQVWHIESLVDKVVSAGCPLVEITGGEPLIQEETPALALALLQSGHRVLVETNGSLDIDRLDRRCRIIMDVKCPGSGQSELNNYANLELLKPHDQVKFVMTDRQDYVFAKRLLKKRTIKVETGNIIFSPVHDRLAPSKLAGWILEDGLFHVRLQLQLHKVIWPGINKGV